MLTLIRAVFCIVTLGMAEPSASNSNLIASPTSGTAPLEVTFTGVGSGMMEGVMQLDFGDGQFDTSISPIGDFARKHTYTAAGSYTAQLKGGPWGGQRPTVLTTLATVTITVR